MHKELLSQSARLAGRHHPGPQRIGRQPIRSSGTERTCFFDAARL